MKRIINQLIFLSLLLFFAVQISPIKASSLLDYEPNQLVVKIDPLGGDINLINVTYGLVTNAPLLGSSDTFLLEALPGVDVTHVVGLLVNHPLVKYAELNYRHDPPEGHGDSTYAWGGEDSGPREGQSMAEAIDLAEAHTISKGAGTIVAVLDTGVQLDHPALASQIYPIGVDFIDGDTSPADSANGIDDDGDGAIDESVGHGTHIAGIINLIAPEAQIMPLRVLNSDGRGANFATANAILFAALNGADVINLSLGSSVRSALLNDVLEQAADLGVVVVAAAGNGNTDAKQYPAADACAISVASVGTNNIKSSFSNFGDWVDIAAPGYAIYSPIPTNDYAWWSGTSMATPIIAGQVALLRSMDELSLQQIGQLIGSTAQPVEQMNSDLAGQLGAGLGNMWAPLQHLSAGTFPAQGENVLAGCDP